MSDNKTTFIPGRSRGEGSIFKRHGSSNYFVQYYSNGKTRQESTKSDKLAVAKKILRNRLTDADRGIAPIAKVKRLTYEDAKKLLLADYRNRKLKSLRNPKDGKETVDGMKHLDSFFESNKVLSITPDRLQEFVEKRQADKAENGTINRNLALLRRMLYLISHHHSEYRVPHFPMLKESDARQGFLSYENFVTLREKLPARLHRLATLCYETGVRLGEAKLIQWEQIDLDKLTITLDESQTKSKVARTIPVSQELADMLKLEFQVGRPFPATNINKAWKKARIEAKLPSLLFHDMRRSAISNLTNVGVSPVVARSISGHKTMETFLRYNISNPQTQQDALQKVIASRKKA